MSNLIGQSLGRYHILEQLGEGGMAIVYKAYDTRLERDVAVKVIRTEKLTIETMGKTLKRFEREAKALAKLTHPNIVPITDYGEHDEKPYLVMPYLPGGTLKQKLGKPIPWEDSVRLLIPIVRALHYAHQQGIIHRDVKPSNILITQSGEPMLTDFGIAKILLDTEETADLTGTGMGVGTPEYMSPEQVTAKSVDSRADIYALGVVFYEMVTGRKPFTADTPMAVLFKHASEPLPRPKEFVPSLPDAVENILIKALAKRVEDRFQSMAELDNAVQKLTNEIMFNDGSLSKVADTPKKQYLTVRQQRQTTVSHENQDAKAIRMRSSWRLVGAGLAIICVIVLAAFGVDSYLQNLQSQQYEKDWATAQAFRSQSTATEQEFRIQATSTEQARQVQATATEQASQMQATATEQAYQLQIVATNQARLDKFNAWNIVLNEQFDDNENGWSIGNQDYDYYSGNIIIESGKLIWEVFQSKQGFVSWKSPSIDDISDFYLSVEARRISGPITSCYGLRFRGNSSDYYFFRVCDDQTYSVYLRSDKNGWETLKGLESSSVINPNGVNKLAVSALGSTFEFYINDQLVNTLVSTRWSSGDVSIMIDLDEGDQVIFEFDNFVVRTP